MQSLGYQFLYHLSLFSVSHCDVQLSTYIFVLIWLKHITTNFKREIGFFYTTQQYLGKILYFLPLKGSWPIIISDLYWLTLHLCVDFVRNKVKQLWAPHFGCKSFVTPNVQRNTTQRETFKSFPNLQGVRTSLCGYFLSLIIHNLSERIQLVVDFWIALNDFLNIMARQYA